MKFSEFLIESSDAAVLKKSKELIRILTSEMGAQVKSVEAEEGILTISISGRRQAKVADVKAIMKPEFLAVRTDRASEGVDWHFKMPDSVDYSELETKLT